MSPFFRIGLAMAITVCMTSCVQGGKVAQAVAAAVAIKTAKGNNNNNQPQQIPAPSAPAPSAPAPSAPAPSAPAPSALALGPTGTTGQLVAVPLTKMQSIIKTVTSCQYPYRCSAFAGDYCNRQCTVICAPPL